MNFSRRSFLIIDNKALFFHQFLELRVSINTGFDFFCNMVSPVKDVFFMLLHLLFLYFLGVWCCLFLFSLFFFLFLFLFLGHIRSYLTLVFKDCLCAVLLGSRRVRNGWYQFICRCCPKGEC